MSNVLFLNDTDKSVYLRINIAGVEPTVVTVEPQKQKALFMKTDTLLFKIWPDNVVMVQDQGTLPSEKSKL
jgi:hypothetical protein